MSINYVRDDIAWNAFQNYVKMKEKQIQFLITSLTALELTYPGLHALR